MGEQELKPKKVRKAESTEVPIEEYEQRVTRLPEPVPMQYVALVGLNYGCTEENPNGERIEVGETVPASTVEASPWLLERGHVRLKEAAIE